MTRKPKASAVSITATKELEPFWAAAGEFAIMTDEQIIELVHEDLSAFLDDCKWTVNRVAPAKVRRK